MFSHGVSSLEEKFAVHSDEKKAKAFQDLTETFLQNPAFEHREQGKVRPVTFVNEAGSLKKKS